MYSDCKYDKICAHFALILFPTVQVTSVTPTPPLLRLAQGDRIEIVVDDSRATLARAPQVFPSELKEQKPAAAKPHGSEENDGGYYGVLPEISAVNGRPYNAAYEESNVRRAQQTHAPNEAKAPAAQCKAQAEKNVMGSSRDVRCAQRDQVALGQEAIQHGGGGCA